MAGALLGVVVVAWYSAGSAYFDLGFAGSLIALATLSALLGVVLILLQFVLISRAPWLERVFGFEELTRIHRINGFVAFVLVSVHIPLIIAGNSSLSGLGFLEQLNVFQNAYQYIPLAILAHLLLVITIASSVIIVRKRLKYELWHLLHFLNYGVLFLALAHQLAYGTTLNSEQWFRWFWLGMHTAVLAHLVFYRFVRPLLQYRRHRFYVDRVVHETDSVVSIYVGGRDIEKLVYSPGQFLKWRFLQEGVWAEEHPFTISQAPDGVQIRCTVKATGDYTQKLVKSLSVGARVILSGPFGRFTLARSQKNKILLIAGGIGITPLRAMLEGADTGRDITLIYSGRSSSDFPLKGELDALAEARKVKLHYIASRGRARGMHAGRIDSDFLHRNVADITERAVFVCGPESMIRDVGKALRGLGVKPQDIHTERFSL